MTEHLTAMTLEHPTCNTSHDERGRIPSNGARRAFKPERHMAVTRRYYILLALSIVQCIVCAHLIEIFAVENATKAIWMKRDPQHNAYAKCGHVCF